MHEREGEGIPSPRSMGGEPRVGGIGVVRGWPLNDVGGRGKSHGDAGRGGLIGGGGEEVTRKKKREDWDGA